jgi:hypothetical protein
MKVITKAGFVRISLLFLSIAALIIFLLLQYNYKTVSIVSSPDNHFKAYHIDSMSEAGAAPYGTHIYIASWWQHFPQLYLEPVFAGYCIGKPVVKWANSQELMIEINVKEKKIYSPSEIKP